MNNLIMVFFFVALLLVHVPVTWWWQRRMFRGVDEPTRQSISHDIRGHWIRLLAAQTLILICAGAWLVLSPEAVRNSQLQSGSIGMATIGFHIIWWPFVFPLALRLDKSLRAHGVLAPLAQPGPVRTASLRARQVSEYLPAWSTPLEVALVVIGLTAVGARALTAPDLHTPLLWSAGMFAFFAVAFVIGYAFWIRFEVQQSYSPLQETATDDDIEAHRRFRIRAIYFLQIAAATTFFAVAAIVVEVARGTLSGPTAGLIGGTAGAVLGIGGGIFGTVASVRAARLHRSKQYREHL
jgi:hypothetical protein